MLVVGKGKAAICLSRLRIGAAKVLLRFGPDVEGAVTNLVTATQIGHESL